MTPSTTTGTTATTVTTASSYKPFVVFVVFVVCVVVPPKAQAQERVAEILVHGNHTTPEADILALAQLSVGEDASPERLGAVQRRLEESRRFAAVEIRRRYRSLTTTTDILVVILVDEHAAVSPDALVPGPLRRLRAAAMWMPIVTYVEGDGFTYGARAGLVEPFGSRSRISAPLTWGGERRAGVELELPAHAASHQLFTFRASASIWRNQNPFFQEHETRRELTAEVAREILPWLDAAVTGRAGRVTFAGDTAWHKAAGVGVTVDTRDDPSFPRNAVYAKARWERIDFSAGAAGRATVDAHGYLGLVGATVLAVRGALVRADAPLPPAEQLLVGGPATLRGYRAGHRSGDGLALLSAELRVPLTSPLDVGRFGAKAFIDAATPWAATTPLSAQRFERGVGGGVYFGAGPLAANVDVGWPEEGKPRVHVGVGLTF